MPERPCVFFFDGKANEGANQVTVFILDSSVVSSHVFSGGVIRVRSERIMVLLNGRRRQVVIGNL